MNNFVTSLFKYIKSNKLELITFIKNKKKFYICINLKEKELLLNELVKKKIICPKKPGNPIWNTFLKQLNNYNFKYINKKIFNDSFKLNDKYVFYYNNFFHPKSIEYHFNKIMEIKKFKHKNIIKRKVLINETNLHISKKKKIK